MQDMIQDLALILIVAGVVTLLFKKLKQPLVLGYIVAGFMVSLNMPYFLSVHNIDNVEQWADIGVTFLLFSLGLDFSFKKILKMGIAPVVSAITIVTCMMILGYVVGQSFGWTHLNCMFLGGMLAMSSTTIIYKAFDDLGLRTQRFASLVMSVLILEDILAIVMMVMLSAIAKGNNPDTGEMMLSVARIGFFLVLWFVVGLYLVPLFLRATRKLMTAETLLVVSLGLCCLMAVISVATGFSSAFGAFVMGSILAETVDAEKIERTIEPVKNLFGAIFFVSVGMLVDPKILVEYSVPILVLVLAIIFGQMIFGTLGFFLSGQPLKTAMRCGFSMAQIGEFAFIIASMGLSLGVVDSYLYPVVVAVSVITTFLTPYMIRFALPAYSFLERHLPSWLVFQLNHFVIKTPGSNPEADGNGIQDDPTMQNLSELPMRTLWHRLLKSMLLNTAIYSILMAAVTMVMLSFFLLFVRQFIPHWWANGLTGVLTVFFLAPFMRAIVMKKNRSEEWKILWALSPMNRVPLISTIVARVVVCLAFLFYICNYLARFANTIVILLGLVVILLVVISRSTKQRSIRMERMFKTNLRSRDVAAQVKGTKLPTYAEHLIDRDLHTADLIVPENSVWAGQTLAELNLGQNFGVHVSSILRSGRRMNIPYGVEQIFSGDKLQVIGTDDQISNLNSVMQSALYPEDDREAEEREMVLRQIVITKKSAVYGKTLRESHIRENYALLVVGIEEGQTQLTSVNPDHVFEYGDIVWMVGERSSFARLGY